MHSNNHASIHCWCYSSPPPLPASAAVRCGSNVVGLSARCCRCQWDMCSKCMQELRQQQQQQSPGQRGRSHSSSPDSNGTSSRQPGSSNGSSSQPPFVWTCCCPTCPGAPQQQQQQQQSSGLSGGRLWCLPGAAPLQLLLQLPRDLVKPQQVVTDHQQQQQQHGRMSLTPVAPGQPCGGISSCLTTLYTRLHSIAQVSRTVGKKGWERWAVYSVEIHRGVHALQQAACFAVQPVRC
jgi:hypothetical protein